MRLLVGLRLFQAVAGIGEIGAAVLQVIVEEERVERIADIVMMRDVAARFAYRIRRNSDLSLPALPLPSALRPALFPRPRADDQLEQVEDRAVLDGQTAIHVQSPT